MRRGSVCTSADAVAARTTDMLSCQNHASPLRHWQATAYAMNSPLCAVCGKLAGTGPLSTRTTSPCLLTSSGIMLGLHEPSTKMWPCKGICSASVPAAHAESCMRNSVSGLGSTSQGCGISPRMKTGSSGGAAAARSRNSFAPLPSVSSRAAVASGCVQSYARCLGVSAANPQRLRDWSPRRQA